MSDLDKAVKGFFNPEQKITLKTLFEEVEKAIENIAEDVAVINEAVGKESRFSYSIAIPKLVPTEAWGDPDSVDRAQINKVFSTIRGGASMEKRIQDLNKFLTPDSAKRRRSPSVILNMMMKVR